LNITHVTDYIFKKVLIDGNEIYYRFEDPDLFSQDDYYWFEHTGNDFKPVSRLENVGLEDLYRKYEQNRGN